MSGFQPARRAALKGRVALCGPTGSGKTWTALGWARQLGDKVALIDTEHRSASLYADEYTFDTLVIEPPYDPHRLIAAVKDAQAEAYDVLVIDSLSHFWEGEGGVLDVVDREAANARGNKYVAWGVGTPLQRKMMDALLTFDGHIVATMRSKMDYAQEKDERGKTQIVKLGMAPIQRNGVEYEFTLVGDLDQRHQITISKSRCKALADRVVPAGEHEQAAVEFVGWLGEGDPLASRVEVDALIEGMNEIEDTEIRAAAKRSFVAVFGRPEQLSERQLEDARKWVAANAQVTGTEPFA